MKPKTFVALKMTFSLLFTFTAAFGLTPRFDDCVDRTCGNHTIRYPFWIAGQQPSYCGYPPFILTCINQTGTPVLSVLGFEFYINHIFYENESIQVTSSFYANNNPCPFIFLNITSNLFPFTLSSSNKHIVFFNNCSRSKNLLSYQNMSCNGTSSYFGGEFPGHDGLSLPGEACKLKKVPVVGNSPITIKSNFTALLKDGWLLNWIAPDCSKCRNSGGGCGYNESTGGFMCICRDRTHLINCGFSGHQTSSKKITIIIVVSITGFLFCLCVLHLLHYRTSNEEKEERVEALMITQGSLFPKRYKYYEIKEMTKSFNEKLGQGGFGTVYKGTLKDGHPVAVKVLSNSTENVHFINEVASISRTSHVNIVNLLGFCLKGSKRALVYEFMTNGSLDKYIYVEKSKSLACERLYEIAMGIAQGLEYLHCRCNTRIVHFDIKPHNILLDQDFCPKISDFGLAKLCNREESILSMAIPRGTLGYIAPEVYCNNFGAISSKSDVYSYGMLVLEMLGVKRDFNVAIASNSDIYFSHWIHNSLNTTNDDITEIAYLNSENKQIVRKMIIVSLWCIQMFPTNRPSMSMVVAMLEGSINDLQMPPNSH